MNPIIQRNILAHKVSISKYLEAEHLYLNTIVSLSKLSKQFKISRKGFTIWLKSRNVQIRNLQNETKFNQHVFDSIDTEEKAYWLGFIFADGYVSTRDNTFEVSLKLSDFEHLEKLKKFLEWSGTVKKDSFRCRLSVVNKHLKQTLVNYGCTPRKSLTLKFPN